jgi:hypothetical protein
MAEGIPDEFGLLREWYARWLGPEHGPDEPLDTDREWDAFALWLSNHAGEQTFAEVMEQATRWRHRVRTQG